MIHSPKCMGGRAVRVRVRGFLLALPFVIVAAAAAWAQHDEECESGCEDQMRSCVEYCGSHDNPMDCEAECREQREDCVHECRR